jgi:hypothetical protein
MLVCLTLRPLAVIAAMVAIVGTGQFIAIAVWEWMFRRAERWADQDDVSERQAVTDSGTAPRNVYSLAERRARRVTA